MPAARSSRNGDEAKALSELESLLWPRGPICPHCGERERLYSLEGVRGHKGEIRLGLRKCGACRRQFTVRTGSVLARSPVAPSKWVEALRLAASEGAALNPHRLHRLLGVTYRTAIQIKERLQAGFARPPQPVRLPNSLPEAWGSTTMVFGRITFGGDDHVAADNVLWRWAKMRDQANESVWVV